MASSDNTEIESKSRNGIFKTKPTYVKRLNFGQCIRNLNTIDRSNTLNSNKFIVDKNVAKIPTVEKEDFVRKWIETYNYDIDISYNESSQSSPVLGAPVFKKEETSPVLGACKYQNKTRSKSNYNLTKKELYKQVDTSPVLGSVQRNNRKRLYRSCEKEQTKLYDLPNANVDGSPVLIRDTCCYKRKRRRRSNIENNPTHKLNTPTDKPEDCIDRNMNLLPVNVPKNLNSYNNKNKKVYLSNDIAGRSSVTSALTKINFVTQTRPKDKRSPVIESVSSDDSNIKEITDVDSSNDETISGIIEDTDTVDVMPLAKASKGTFYSKTESIENKTPFKIKNQWTVASLKDSDETFFSQAESIPSTLSSNYSLNKPQSTIASNDSIDGRSSQTNFVISDATSPVRTNSWPAMTLEIIDSCKKRRKIKKKSLTGKLQSLISRQTSFVRMWHHQMKQADLDGTSMPHVVVYVNKCTVHFYRQFLEGIILEDPFNLLDNNENNRSRDSSEPSRETSNKTITMIIIPDIVGKIEMKSESIVKIYPPWDIMDETKMILNITYIKIMSNEQRKLILSKSKIPDRTSEKVLVKEFHCLCLKADKVLSSCKERSNNEKPDVMEELFKF